MFPLLPLMRGVTLRSRNIRNRALAKREALEPSAARISANYIGYFESAVNSTTESARLLQARRRISERNPAARAAAAGFD